MPARSRRGLMAADAETDEGGPHGLLMWGQAGVYNSPDDRLVIAALSDAVTGIVKPARLTPGPGLTFNLAAGWLAIASCADGTTAVAGSRQSHVIGPSQGVTAGPATGTRTDLLWCDVQPDEGTWALTVIRQAESAGRAGVPLAMITVPPGANLATQMSLSHLVPTFGAHAESTMASTSTGSNAQAITPSYQIAPWMIRARSHFRLRAFGWGRWGASVRHVMFRLPLTASPQMWLNLAGLGFPAGREFSWEAEARVQCRMNRQNISIGLSASLRPGQGQAGEGRNWNAVTAVQNTALTQWNPDTWNVLNLAARFDASAAGQLIECTSSTFETIEPYDA